MAEHVTGAIAAPLAGYLQAVQESADAREVIAAAEERMCAAVAALRGIPGLSEEVVAQLIQADTTTVRRLAKQGRRSSS